MNILQEISGAVQSGSTLRTAELTCAAMKEQIRPAALLRDGLVTGLLEAVKRFHRGEILDTEVLVAERAMKAGLELLIPLLKEEREAPIGTVVTGTLEGDIRDIEKDIISIMMQSIGLKVIDVGTSVPVVHFIEAAAEGKAQIIAVTASLTIFLPQMKSLTQAASQANMRGKTKILLSGGPVTEWFCKSIEADMYAPDPIRAAEIAAEYCRRIKQ